MILLCWFKMQKIYFAVIINHRNKKAYHIICGNGFMVKNTFIENGFFLENHRNKISRSKFRFKLIGENFSMHLPTKVKLIIICNQLIVITYLYVSQIHNNIFENNMFS